MQTGKISSIIRQLAATSVSSLGAGKRDRESGGGEYQSQKQDREPTQEEAEAAAKILCEDDALLKSGLKAQVINIEGRLVIEITDTSARKLKTLKGAEILSVLIKNSAKPEGGSRGRILDRSV